MLEYFNRHLENIKGHWPNLPERVIPTPEEIKK